MFPSGSVPGPRDGEEAEDEKETYRIGTGSLLEDPSLDPSASAGPHEFRRRENRCQKQWYGRLGELGTKHKLVLTCGQSDGGLDRWLSS